jgi:hypothetical protein
MGQKALWFVAVILILGAIAYWWPKPSSAPASITVTSPSGGETWQPGETHPISWVARGVPANDKISVTIRRIPPPPLAEEGQEFDPVIFTDAPNTGSTTWKISPMYPDGVYVLGLHAYESLPITNGVSAESAQFTIMHPKLDENLYPLYSGAEWGAIEAENLVIGSTTYRGASLDSLAIPAGMNPADVFMPFEQYYEKKLRDAGWTVANDLAAGGHVGGQTGYRKNGDVILTRFRIDYQNKPADAPSKCPCDVTLSLFSTAR